MIKVKPIASDRDYPWNNPWPKGGLETLGKCPVCGVPDRHILHSDLVDNTFFCAPGVWQLWQCTKCSSAYLDPRPTTTTIGLAYKSYYTHQISNSKLPYTRLSWLRKQRRKLANAYTNWRFGTDELPTVIYGSWLLRALPILRHQFDREFRHLPKEKGASATLLDIGCGTGGFLSMAKKCGWDVVGLDPDPKAVDQAKTFGIDVRLGGIEAFSGQSEKFDVINLSHVIEHIHDPTAILDACYRLLKPGGMLWLETPSIKALSRSLYGRDWRGLEAPRHLVIFSPIALKGLMKRVGFLELKRESRPIRSLGIFKESWLIKNGRGIHSAEKVSISFKIVRIFIILFEALNPKRREMITMSAHKPKKIQRDR